MSESSRQPMSECRPTCVRRASVRGSCRGRFLSEFKQKRDAPMSKYKFVYSKRLADFLIRDKGLRFITYAKHPKTDRLFWVFERGPALDRALAEYEKLPK